MISFIYVIFLREGTFHADNSPGCGGLKTEDNYDQHQIQLILLIVSLAHLLSLQGKAEQYYIYYPFRNQFLHFILDIGVLCSVRESQIVFSAFFLIHSIYCFLSLIQRLQKLKFVEALIENWFSRELSQVLNSITIFQLTPTWHSQILFVLKTGLCTFPTTVLLKNYFRFLLKRKFRHFHYWSEIRLYNINFEKHFYDI